MLYMQDSDALANVIVSRRGRYKAISHMMNHNLTIICTNPN